jgi:hypothetical protein
MAVLPCGLCSRFPLTKGPGAVQESGTPEEMLEAFVVSIWNGGGEAHVEDCMFDTLRLYIFVIGNSKPVMNAL